MPGVPPTDGPEPVPDEPAPAAPPTRQRAVSRRRMVVAVLGLFALIFGGLTGRWFIWPPSDHPAKVDAIVVLGGGAGERYTKGMELLHAHVADVMVFSTGLRINRYQEMDNVWDLCDHGTTEFELHCLVAEPDNTKGEAISISKLAREHGWKSIALVTSDHHMKRASIWFDRCFDGTVYEVVASAPTSMAQLTHEWLGTLEALVLDRSCSA